MLPLPPAWPASRIIECVLAASVRPSTRRSYTSPWRSFVAFCEEHRCRPLPATRDSVLAWLASLCSRAQPPAPQTVASSLSALRWVHSIQGQPFPEPAAFARFLDGYHLLFAEFRHKHPHPSRLPLPASDVEAVIRAVLSSPAGTVSLSLLRAAAALVCGFLCFARASSLLALTAADVTLTPDILRVSFARCKTRDVTNPLVLYYRAASPLARDALRLLRCWHSARPASCEGWLQLDREPLPRPEQASSHLSEWVRTALAFAGVSQPRSGYFSSHSLRKGGCSSAFRVGMELDLIRRRGDWRQSTVALDLYADSSALPTSADLAFWSAYAAPAGARL